ncbi:MAG: prolipoprotein diacylglyceryl transferase [Deltaproteobacteria bacterium]|nr:prolipoprotein diacylglyceryl transferase [Deltaproteobacteria bacterium]MBN2674684.1 prolipoprotein diacylglyceryl transferase [Deltaproteobacteria bacterium]
MEHGFVWDLDPVIAYLGPLQLRYYGIIFASMLYIGFIIWRKQMLRGGYSLDLAERFLIWGVLAVLIGARLGHCFFYEPERYLADPITILHFWKGGLASHGATVGLVVTMALFCKKYNLRYLEVLDRMSMPSAVGAAAVRLGNFFNSEIVGRPTDGTWGVDFVRYNAMMGEPSTLRHPSQLYEFFMGMFVLLALYLADKWAGKEKRPLGLLAGLFLVLYFAGRFTVEYFKEFQTLEDSALTMGQYLSIIPFTAGVVLLGRVAVKRIPTDEGREERIAATNKKLPSAASKSEKSAGLTKKTSGGKHASAKSAKSGKSKGKKRN